MLYLTGGQNYLGEELSRVGVKAGVVDDKGAKTVTGT